MKLGDVRSFIGEALANLGLKEWRDGFNFENIPASVLTNSFHVTTGSLSIDRVDQKSHAFRMPMTVNLFFRGFRDPWTARDEALNKGHDVMNALLKPGFRLASMPIKDVRFVNLTARPLTASNDNSLVLELVFECLLIYSFS